MATAPLHATMIAHGTRFLFVKKNQRSDFHDSEAVLPHILPWTILSFPHERPRSISDSVCGQYDTVGCDALEKWSEHPTISTVRNMAVTLLCPEVTLLTQPRRTGKHPLNITSQRFKLILSGAKEEYSQATQ